MCIRDRLVVTIGYDIENLTDPERRRKYRGEVVKDHYGRQIPKHALSLIHISTGRTHPEIHLPWSEHPSGNRRWHHESQRAAARPFDYGYALSLIHI